MRTYRITGVVVSSALVAVCVGGALGPTSASAEARRHAQRPVASVAQPAVPSASDAATALARIKMLSGTAPVVEPAGRLVHDALAKPLSVESVTKDAAAARAAIDAARAKLPAKSALQAQPGRSAQPRSNRDLVSDALTSLETAIDALIDSLTDADGLLDSVSDVISDLLDSVLLIVFGTDAATLPATTTTTTTTTTSTPAL